jgi:hypothetical protein
VNLRAATKATKSKAGKRKIGVMGWSSANTAKRYQHITDPVRRANPGRAHAIVPSLQVKGFRLMSSG